VIAHVPGKWRAISAMAVENKAAQALPQTLEMKKYQRAICIDDNFIVSKLDLVVTNIPGRKICADVFDHSHPARPACKQIEITLVGKTISIDVVMTPLDAFFSPPLDDGNSVTVVAHPNPSNIVGSKLSQPIILG
jgi:hypothetical protein